MVDSAEDSKMDRESRISAIYLAGQPDMLTHNNYTVQYYVNHYNKS